MNMERLKTLQENSARKWENLKVGYAEYKRKVKKCMKICVVLFIAITFFGFTLLFFAIIYGPDIDQLYYEAFRKRAAQEGLKFEAPRSDYEYQKHGRDEDSGYLNDEEDLNDVGYDDE